MFEYIIQARHQKLFRSGINNIIHGYLQLQMVMETIHTKWQYLSQYNVELNKF